NVSRSRRTSSARSDGVQVIRQTIIGQPSGGWPQPWRVPSQAASRSIRRVRGDGSGQPPRPGAFEPQRGRGQGRARGARGRGGSCCALPVTEVLRDGTLDVEVAVTNRCAATIPQLYEWQVRTSSTTTPRFQGGAGDAETFGDFSGLQQFHSAIS